MPSGTATAAAHLGRSSCRALRSAQRGTLVVRIDCLSPAESRLDAAPGDGPVTSERRTFAGQASVIIRNRCIDIARSRDYDRDIAPHR